MIKDLEKTVEAGSAWLRDYVQGAGKQAVVIGLSGGIDSATAFMWALRTFSAERDSTGRPVVQVIPVMMPYGLPEEKAYLTRSSGESVQDAVELITAAQMQYQMHIENFLLPITAPVDSVIETLGIQSDPEFEIARANLKARMRAVYLRTVANGVNGIILGTENLTENLLGYFTIGGDEESDMEMLSNFSKREVRSLARHLGVTPNILHKEPSADLWSGQTDEGELGFTYEEADAIVEMLRATGKVPAPTSMTEEQVKVVVRIKKTEFKRQSKPTFPGEPLGFSDGVDPMRNIGEPESRMATVDA